MAGTFNGNSQYINIDGVDVSTLYNEVGLTRNIGSEETTAGSGVTDIQRAEGLKDTSVNLKLKYNVGTVPANIQYMKPGLHTIILGPEGNVAGKPKHQQDFIIESTDMGTSVKKTAVYFTLSGKAADAPVVDMFNGGVF